MAGLAAPAHQVHPAHLPSTTAARTPGSWPPALAPCHPAPPLRPSLLSTATPISPSLAPAGSRSSAGRSSEGRGMCRLTTELHGPSVGRCYSATTSPLPALAPRRPASPL